MLLLSLFALEVFQPGLFCCHRESEDISAFIKSFLSFFLVVQKTDFPLCVFHVQLERRVFAGVDFLINLRFNAAGLRCVLGCVCLCPAALSFGQQQAERHMIHCPVTQ